MHSTMKGKCKWVFLTNQSLQTTNLPRHNRSSIICLHYQFFLQRFSISRKDRSNNITIGNCRSIRTNIKKFQKPLNYFTSPIQMSDDTELLLSRNIGCFIYWNAQESAIFNFLVNLILDDRIYAFNEIVLNL